MQTKRRILLALLGALVLAVTAAAVSASTARAAGGNTTVEFGASVDDRRVLVDTGLVYFDGCIIGDDPRTCPIDLFPGTVWFRVRAGVKSTSVVTQTADLSVEAPTELKKGSPAAIKSTLVAKDGPAKEVRATTTPFVMIDLAYDKIGADCAKDRIKDVAELEAAQTTDCLDFVKHTGDLAIPYSFALLEADTILPYSGSQTISNTRSTPRVDIGALIGLPGILGARLDFVTTAVLSASNGYLADRSVVAGGAPIASGQLQWPTPDPVVDTVSIPTGVADGAAVEYRLSNARWEGNAKVTGAVQLALDIVDPVPDPPPLRVVSATLFDQPIVGRASDFSAPLGSIAKPPADPGPGGGGGSDEPAPALDCSQVRSVPRLLTPVNGTLRLITLKSATNDAEISITGVRQDERVSGKGDIGPDAKTAKRSDQVYVRAQRDAKGDGRVYTIAFEATDGKSACTGKATVGVPTKNGKAPIKSKLNLDSFKR